MISPSDHFGQLTSALSSGAASHHARRLELTRDAPPRNSRRQTLNQTHGLKEEKEASSPRGLSRAENERRDRVAGEDFGEIQTPVTSAARASGVLRTAKESRGGVQGAL